MDTTPKSQINNITPNWGNEEIIYYKNKWQVKKKQHKIGSQECTINKLSNDTTSKPLCEKKEQEYKTF